MKPTLFARKLAIIVLVGAVAAPAFAQEQPKPPPCTAKKKTNCTPTPDHPKDPTSQQ